MITHYLSITLQKRSLVEPLIILKGAMANEEATHKMTTLIDHVDRLDAQVEGEGFFTLNKGMATTVVNTVVTYLVVLIQFYGGSS
ncbi:7TM chemoreceptor [Trinorchestia longiramus]|nr:7TM chemoreceptor [Trinorchestia longiramus]